MPVPRGGTWRDEHDRNEDLLARSDDLPVIRASDGEREAVVAQLNDAVGEGRLTLQEFSERLDRAYAASTRGNLAPLTADLPGMDLVRGPARHRRVMLGILFDSRRAGPRPLDDEIAAIAFLGDVIIDLRDAKITAAPRRHGRQRPGERTARAGSNPALPPPLHPHHADLAPAIADIGRPRHGLLPDML